MTFADELEQAGAARLLPHLRGKRVFVTGGTGFVGRWVLELLAMACEWVDVLTRNPSAFRAEMPRLAERKALRFWAGDVRGLGERMPERYDLVLHLAGPTDYATSHDETLDIIVNGTRRVLEFAKRCGAERLLLVSSGAVYGPHRGNVPEASPYAMAVAGPRGVYAAGKVVAEILARANTVPTVIARPFALVGPGLPLDSHYAVGNFLRDALAGGPVRVTGDGTAVRSYLYAADLAVWLLTLLCEGTPGEAYNVGSEFPWSVNALAHAVARSVSPAVAVEEADIDPSRPPDRYVPDTAKARALGLRETVPLAEALARTVRHLRGGDAVCRRVV